jgi:hypothetical protein
MPGVGFIRVKLLQVERGQSMDSKADVFDPYIAINVKEAVNTPGKASMSFPQCHDDAFQTPTTLILTKEIEAMTFNRLN